MIDLTETGVLRVTLDNMGIVKGPEHYLALPLDDLYDTYSIYLTDEEIDSHIFKSTVHAMWEDVHQLNEIRKRSKSDYLGILAQELYNYLSVEFFYTHIEPGMNLSNFISTDNIYDDLGYRKAKQETVVAYIHASGIGRDDLKLFRQLSIKVINQKDIKTRWQTFGLREYLSESVFNDWKLHLGGGSYDGRQTYYNYIQIKNGDGLLKPSTRKVLDEFIRKIGTKPNYFNNFKKGDNQVLFFGERIIYVKDGRIVVNEAPSQLTPQQKQGIINELKN